MTDTANPHAMQPNAAAFAATEARAEFLRKTYMHLAGAIFAFVVLETVLMQTSLPEAFVGVLGTAYWSWLIVLGLFMGTSYLAQRWAMTANSVGLQYAGLGLEVVAWSVIFMLPVYYAANAFPPESHVLTKAAILTLAVFSGLTMIVFTTKKDFSFLGPFLRIAGFGIMGYIVLGIFFGFSFGDVFTVALIAFASGAVLYSTSNVLNRYPVGSHVAAALDLFASIALLFWYILQLVMSLAGND
jgi:FtsH-binding integral membrane protein